MIMTACPYVTFAYLVLHTGACAFLREKRRKFLDEETRLSLSGRGQRSCWRIHYLLTACELYFETMASFQSRGLLSTYAIPTISKTLQDTGGFERDVQRRYADMEILIQEFNESAPDGTTSWNGQPDRASKVRVFVISC